MPPYPFPTTITITPRATPLKDFRKSNVIFGRSLNLILEMVLSNTNIFLLHDQLPINILMLLLLFCVDFICFTFCSFVFIEYRFHIKFTVRFMSSKVLKTQNMIHICGKSLEHKSWCISSTVKDIRIVEKRAKCIQSFPSPRLVASLRLKNLVCPTIYP